MAAALAYYALFALPPLLYLILTVVTFGMSLAYDGDEAKSRASELIENNVTELVGNESAAAEVSTIVRRSHEPKSAWWRSLIGLGVVLFVATGIVTAIQTSLNRVFGVRISPDSRGVKTFFGKRLLSFAMILGMGFLLILSTVTSIILAALDAELRRFTGLEGGMVWWTSFGASFFVTVLAFMAMFKFMPHAKIAWLDVLIGSTATTLLFLLGRHALEWYLARADIAAHVGNAAASLAVVLVWVYYSSMIFLFGAELTAAWAEKYGSGVTPQDNAVSVELTLIREKRESPN